MYGSVRGMRRKPHPTLCLPGEAVHSSVHERPDGVGSSGGVAWGQVDSGTKSHSIPMLLQVWRDKGGVLIWPLIEQLLPYGGIRIEDDVFVHTSDMDNMTRDVFLYCRRLS